MERPYKYFTAISVFFVAVLLISNVASTKIVDLHGLVFDGGTLLFPLSYIFGDILTEVYGYKKSRQTIWLGFFCALLMSLVFMLIGALPPAADWANQDAYEKILGLTPRIVGASLIAYFCGEFLNSAVLAKMKVATKGRFLWLRTISSTVAAQLLDTLLFTAIAFWGILPNSVLIAIFLSNYTFKIAIEVLFTPLTYRIVAFLKREEQEDFYDRETDFNPFRR